jgi:hypothetical protein
MTNIAPAEEVFRFGQHANPGEALTSPRQAWEDKRRFMERQKAHFGPDGPRSLWRGRIFSSGLRMFAASNPVPDQKYCGDWRTRSMAKLPARCIGSAASSIRASGQGVEP